MEVVAEVVAEAVVVIADVEVFVEGVLQEAEVAHREVVVVALEGAEGDFRTTFCNFSSALLFLCCQLRMHRAYYNRMVFMLFLILPFRYSVE